MPLTSLSVFSVKYGQTGTPWALRCWLLSGVVTTRCQWRAKKRCSKIACPEKNKVITHNFQWRLHGANVHASQRSFFGRSLSIFFPSHLDKQICLSGFVSHPLCYVRKYFVYEVCSSFVVSWMYFGCNKVFMGSVTNYNNGQYKYRHNIRL